MDQQDETQGSSTDNRVPAATRRTVLSVTALGGASASVAGFLRSTDSQEGQRIELGGETAGWVGRAPSDIEDETNPTLTLTAGETYEIVWENLDGAPHNVVIQSGDGSQLVRSDIVQEQGATQTVEFTASEEMAEYYCEVHPNTMRGDITVEAETTETPTETEEETTEEETTEEETTEEEPEETSQPTFDPDLVKEHRGDVATFTLSLGDYDQAQVVVGSREVNYAVSFTAVDGNGDGEVTVAIDTTVAGQGDDPGFSAMAEDDQLRDYEQATPTLSSPLEPAVYPLEAYVDGRLVADGVLVLQPRETRGATAGVAPRLTFPTSADFADRITARQRVATGDWAVVVVETTGVYATLDDISAFQNDSLGYELAIERTDPGNRKREIPLEDIIFVTDPANDRFFVIVDTEPLPVESTYETTFAITDANPYVSEGDGETVSTAFTVGERTASFDVEGDTLTVPPSETELGGTSTVAPGTTITVVVSGTEDAQFLDAARSTVTEDGFWSATFDFSGLEPETPFQARVIQLSDPVEGMVTSDE